LKSTETVEIGILVPIRRNFSNFGSLKSTETRVPVHHHEQNFRNNFSNFGSLKITETMPPPRYC